MWTDPGFLCLQNGFLSEFSQGVFILASANRVVIVHGHHWPLGTGDAAVSNTTVLVVAPPHGNAITQWRRQRYRYANMWERHA